MQWAKRALFDFVFVLAAWIFAITERLRKSGAFMSAVRGEIGAFDVLQFAAWATTSAQLLGLAFACNYICGAQIGVIDVFCQGMMERTPIIMAVHEWNLLQAVLRRASKTLELILLALQAVTLATVLLAALDVTQGGRSLVDIVPVAFLMSYVTQAFFRAAAVTDKCARVPQLVNSLGTEQDMDLERQYVVQYIINSSAGFHMFEVLVTSAMVLKLTYVGGALVFALTARATCGTG